MNDFNNLNREDLIRVSKKGEQIVAPQIASYKLIEKTYLKSLQIYPRHDLMYLYNWDKGYYIEINTPELELIVRKLLVKGAGRTFLSLTYVKQVVSILKQEDDISNLGDPSYRSDCIVFKNGILNLKTGELADLTPEVLVTSGLNFDYDKSVDCPNFHAFLDEFCNGNPDRKEFIRATFKATIHSEVSDQTFMYFWGPGGTGKTQITLILTALVGHAATLTTSLKALHSDNFEVENVREKKLILISEAGRYKGETSTLKSLTGNDALKGRKKYIQGDFPVIPRGRVVMTSNDLLSITDTSDAIPRRMRIFRADHISKTRKPLIVCTGTEWEGPLAKELPGIFNWANSMDMDLALRYFEHTYTMVPTLSQYLIEANYNINPVENWAKEQLEPGKGSYFGYVSQESPGKAMSEMALRKPLFPTYLGWIKRQGIYQGKLSYKEFSDALLTCSRRLGYECEIVRKTAGMYITGVRVKANVYDRDILLGAPIEGSQNEGSEGILTIDPIGEKSTDHQDNTSLVQSSNNCQSYDEGLYNQYYKCFEKNTLKEDLNKHIRLTFRENENRIVDECLNEYIKDLKVGSSEFKSLAREVIKRGVKQIGRFGGIPYTYKRMGISPRIIPTVYGDSINNTKKVVRNACYEELGTYINTISKEEMVILDLDLVSCYTSILIGLYPEHLQVLQYAIEGPGLWNHIRKEFETMGRLKVYNKPAVKICVYSSFFGGGGKAMINGIMEGFRKDIGLTKPEFKESAFYHDCENIAIDVATEMNKLKVIDDFRTISNYVKEINMGGFLEGPTKHKYPVSENQFSSSYSNYLISFEFALLARSTLRTLEQYPEMEIIGHYHDGNVVVLPKQKEKEIFKCFSDHLSELGREYHLMYTQKLECKRRYPS